MSCCGMPSVMQTTSGISASIASKMAAAAPGGGTCDRGRAGSDARLCATRGGRSINTGTISEARWLAASAARGEPTHIDDRGVGVRLLLRLGDRGEDGQIQVRGTRLLRVHAANLRNSGRASAAVRKKHTSSLGGTRQFSCKRCARLGRAVAAVARPRRAPCWFHSRWPAGSGTCPSCR